MRGVVEELWNLPEDREDRVIALRHYSGAHDLEIPLANAPSPDEATDETENKISHD